jgi:tetratricopeptide (TPR) repeat protein
MTKLPALILLFICFQSHAQTDSTVVRLETKLANSSNIAEQLDIIERLAERTDFENQAACQAYLDKGILLAEKSRNREMMVKARRIAASVYTNGGTMTDRINKAKDYVTTALGICKTEPGIEKEKVLCNNLLARILRTTGKADNALPYNQESISIANQTDDDSLKVISLIGMGNTQLVLDKNLDAFKSYLNAQTIAEKSDHTNKDWLQTSVYNSLAKFYANIEAYDKAIDYQYKSFDYAMKQGNTDDALNVLYAIGGNYINAKKYEAAKASFEEMIQMADSLKEPNLKIQGTVGVLNTIVNSPDKLKGIAYLNEHPEINQFFDKLGITYQLDKGKGDIFHAANKPDSANYYYEKAIPEMDKKASVFNRADAYINYGNHLYSTGNYKKAIEYLQKARLLNDSSNNKSGNLGCLRMLDSCYQKAGDYQNAFFYNSLYQKIDTELKEDSKEKDILALEIDAENKRKERMALEELANTNRRHNWQYMGIVLGIITLFVLLAALGFFQVSLKWVRALGFISFIFLFEFIILLADNWIHQFTHGEPLKVLAIKVVLIAVLLPLHHYLEHKVIHFIAHRKSQKENATPPVSTPSLG